MFQEAVEPLLIPLEYEHRCKTRYRGFEHCRSISFREYETRSSRATEPESSLEVSGDDSGGISVSISAHVSLG